MIRIQAVSIDAAFANMGLARIEIRMDGNQCMGIECEDLELVTTDSDDRKAVRKSSSDLRRAKILVTELRRFCGGINIGFAEVPSGAQSAAAARALGIAVGVIASAPLDIIEVSPMEVKKLFATGRKVSKAEIIEWAVKKWPTAPWLHDARRKGAPLLKANEHLADALAIAYAGVKTPEFQRMIAMHHATSSPPHLGPTPDGQPRRRVPLGVI